MKSESGTTWTVGTVLKAPFDAPALSALTATIDYYHIKIDGAITNLTSQIVYSQCLNSNGISNPGYDFNNAYCQLIRRAATGATDTVLGEFTNIGFEQTSGIDFTLDWHSMLSDMGMSSAPGSLSATLAMSYLREFIVQVAPGDTPVDYKGSTGFDINTGVQFTWKSVLTVGYAVGPASVNVRWRHLPSVENAARVLSPTALVSDTPATTKSICLAIIASTIRSLCGPASRTWRTRIRRWWVSRRAIRKPVRPTPVVSMTSLDGHSSSAYRRSSDG